MSREGEKNVLITGASGGVGQATASLLIRHGWRVFAADFTLGDQALSPSEDRLLPVQMDVTGRNSIQEAFQQISSQTEQLDAIIHMAGILRVGPLVEIPEDHLNRSLEVNMMGAFRVNRQFLPLLMPRPGRIVLLSSETGTQTAAPFNGPYAISKHALEAYADALRRELSLLGIRVIKIQPGPIQTEMTRGGEGQFREAAAASVHFRKALLKGTSYLPGVYRNACDPDVVAAVILKALESPSPRRAYRVKQDRIRDLLDRIPQGWSDQLIKKALTRG
jgi:NAD(P)-dependent dehydrogenase (short-subunit alcohol dehydrogenase family)